MTHTTAATPATGSAITSPDNSADNRADNRARRVTTVIIGAGQAGLATAYLLGRAGHDCVVLERHRRVGDQWRHRYDSLLLNTPARYSSLPGRRFPGPRGAFPTASQLADYHEEYAGHFRIPVEGGVRVTAVEQCPDGTWRVTTDHGTYAAENVVVATGGETHPKVPDVQRLLDPGIRQIHSGEYHNPDQLLPGPVLVVGLGQSGADIALELAESGRDVHVSGRVRQEVPVDIDGVKMKIAIRVLWFVWNHVLTERTKAGRKVKARIRGGTMSAPLIRVKGRHLDAAGVHRTDARTTGAVDGMPQLDDGTVLDVSNVVWCTGFRQDFSFIHPSPVGDDGWPRDEGGVVPNLPGLYFMGLLFQRGFYSMLVGGAGRDAEHVAGHILARSRIAA
ncbi:MAG: NAD(P)-binding domain-containing protein [Nocardioides sp.]|nr:NAD(P)-binding domain-containing protein [Nocardioides sp.]